MGYPVWTTASGSLGKIAAQEYFNLELKAIDPENANDPDAISYVLSAGRLPKGLRISDRGSVSGNPEKIYVLEGVPFSANRDIFSEFTIRAISTSDDTITERTFNLTVTGNFPPEITTGANFSTTTLQFSSTTGVVTGMTAIGSGLSGYQTITVVNVTETSVTVNVAISVTAGTQITFFDNLNSVTLTTTAQSSAAASQPLGTFLDGTEVNLQLEGTDLNNDPLTWSLAGGSLPAGLALSSDGLISGVIKPQVYAFSTSVTGWDLSQWDRNQWEFTTRSNNNVYNFTVAVTDGKSTRTRKFKVSVFSHNDVRADSIDLTADCFPAELLAANPPVPLPNSRITADVTPDRPPVLLTKSLGQYSSVNSGGYFSFKFDAIDYDISPIIYQIDTGSTFGWDGGSNWDTVNWDVDDRILPPGLTLDENTGWLTGYIPTQAESKKDYTFGVSVYSSDDINNISAVRYFTLTILGNLDLAVDWITPTDLGSITTGAISTLSVKATAASNRELSYSLDRGSRLPQGLALLSDGTISGRVSFQTMGFDRGQTTFDKDLAEKFVYSSNTNFDNVYQFTVTASNQSDVISSIATGLEGAVGWLPSTRYDVGDIVIYNGRSYVVIENYYTIDDIVDGKSGFTTGSTFDTTNLSAVSVESQIVYGISGSKTFTIRTLADTYEPFENLFIKCLPSSNNRQVLQQIISNTDIFDPIDVYRPLDPYYGIQSDIKFLVSYGIKASLASNYINAMQARHFNKKFYFGNYKIAQGKDVNGNVLYDVIYVDLIEDTKVYQTANGITTNKIPKAYTNMNRTKSKWRNPRAISLPENQVSSDLENTAVTASKTFVRAADTYYLNEALNVISPNDLTLMQLDITNNLQNTYLNSLPSWMVSVQDNGTILGYTSGAPVAYMKPGTGAKALYNMKKLAPFDIKSVPFVADRYILNNSYTANFDLSSTNGVLRREFFPHKYTTFDHYTKGSNYVTPVAKVDFAVDRPFSSINNKLLEYIIDTNGLDGITYNLNGKLLIFATQEGFSETDWGDLLEYNDGWYFQAPPQDGNPSIQIISLIPGYNDKANIASIVNQQAGIWQIKVNASNIIELQFVQEIAVGSYIYVNEGATHGNSYQLYDINALSQGFTVPKYTQSFSSVLSPRKSTTFDNDNMSFMNNVDTYTLPLAGDKYLKFPKIGVFTNGQ